MAIKFERISQRLAGRIRELAGRYADPLPALTARVTGLEARVSGHLDRMGFGV